MEIIATNGGNWFNFQKLKSKNEIIATNGVNWFNFQKLESKIKKVIK